MQISSKKGFILQNCVLSQTFTPTCQYFYTDQSVISVTVCNSAEGQEEGGGEPEGAEGAEGAGGAGGAGGDEQEMEGEVQ